MNEVAVVLGSLAREMAKHDPSIELPRRLGLSAAALFGVGGVALTLACTEPERVMLCATNEDAAALEDLQDILTQGPVPTAYATGQQIRATLDDAADSRWPELSGAARQSLNVTEVLAVPMRVSGLVMGVLTCYHPVGTTVWLRPGQAQHLADAIGVHVSLNPDAVIDSGSWSTRAAIHQATGMVMSQLQINPDDALTLLKAHAFMSGDTLADIADAVVHRTLDFTVIDRSDEGGSR